MLRHDPWYLHLSHVRLLQHRSLQCHWFGKEERPPRGSRTDLLMSTDSYPATEKTSQSCRLAAAVTQPVPISAIFSSGPPAIDAGRDRHNRPISYHAPLPASLISPVFGSHHAGVISTSSSIKSLQGLDIALPSREHGQSRQRMAGVFCSSSGVAKNGMSKNVIVSQSGKK